MTIISLDNAGSLGLIKDIKPNELPPEAWTQLFNVRCKDNKISAFGGDKLVYDNMSPAYVPVYFYHVYDPNVPYWMAASNGKIFKVNKTSHTDVTKLTTTYSGAADKKWSGFSFHDYQIMNVDSGVDLPQSLASTAANFIDLPNWPAATYAKFMNGYKNFLLAYNITSGGTNFPNRIKWSEVAEPSALPATWDHTDPNSLAGENDSVNVGGGTILCARTLADLNFIYKDNSIWYMYPSNDLNVFKFKQFPEKQGILGMHAITTFKGRHFLAVNGDIVQHNGQGSLQSIIDKKNRDTLFNNLHNDYYQDIQLVTDIKNNEVWVCYADQNSTGGLNRAFIWNAVENTWTERELASFNYLASGIVDTSLEGQVIDDDNEIIDSDSSFMDQISYNPARESVLAANTDFYSLDDTSTLLANAQLEREGLGIVGKDRSGAWKISPTAVKQVTRMYPKLVGQGSFLIQIGFTQNNDETVTWSAAELYTIGSTPHVDFWIQGVALAIRILPQDSFQWSYHGCDLDLTVIAENTV